MNTLNGRVGILKLNRLKNHIIHNYNISKIVDSFRKIAINVGKNSIKVGI